MSAIHHQERFPQGALYFAGSLVGFAFLVTLAVRVGLFPVQASPVQLRQTTHIAAIASRDLRFTDRADGAVVIDDVTTGTVAHVVVPGLKTGFIRGVMRGLARERRMRGIGASPPFRLTLWKDGELSLVDTATGRAIELNAFGTTNRASFAQLLPVPTAKAVE